MKRSQGDPVDVVAVVIRDGHEALRAALRHRSPGEARYAEVPMIDVGNDHFRATFVPEALGRHQFVVEAWNDVFTGWREELRRKREGGQADLSSELVEGAQIVARLARRLRGADRTVAEHAADVLAGANQARGLELALAHELADALGRAPDRPERVRSATYGVDVDRERARRGVWYELFPRSWGGFAALESELPRFAELGVDVLYFPPIHPIGRTHRKGRNNAEIAGPEDPGSPWAIGAREGGHTAIHPDLGTEAELRRLSEVAREHGIEIALDLALNCSPDHPWLAEHPDWFHRRPDGTLKYAENPPKRYQDIYNLNFDSPDWRALWLAIHDVVAYWVERGIRIFRVDNPHTKPVAFWEWLIAAVRAGHPDVVFLSEAFTKPAMMYSLGHVGFSQSYTYFTWRTSKSEIEEYMRELADPRTQDGFRPNFFANTPDILNAYLVDGGRTAFEARLVLAATLSPSYGIYSGFESCEATPVRPGSEEYLDSEKYQLVRRRLDGPLLPLFARLNRIRRDHPALGRIDLRLLETHNPHLIAFGKGAGEGMLLVVVNLDPHAAHEGLVVLPEDLGLPARLRAHDLLGDAVYDWSTGGNYVRLDPARLPAHVLRLEAA